MDPICFTLFGRSIYWYGILMATAFLAAVAHMSWTGRREGRPPGMASELMVWVMLAGIVGARTAYVLGHLREFIRQPMEIPRVDHGGLVYYGGFVGAILLVWIYSRWRRQGLWQLADWIGGALPLGHAIGRVGCFLNGCCYGKPSTAWWAVFSHDNFRLPIQLIEAAFNLALYGVLLWIRPRRQREGDLFVLYLVLYPIGRFLLEFLRGDERLRWMGMNVAQLFSLLLLILAFILWRLARPVRSIPDEAEVRRA